MLPEKFQEQVGMKLSPLKLQNPDNPMIVLDQSISIDKQDYMIKPEN